MSKEFWEAALMRAWHAVWETAAATMPATIVITPAMIEHFDKSFIVVVLAWFLTALFAGVASMIKSMALGIPEVEYKQNISMNVPEPEGSFSEGYLTEEEKAAIREEMGGDEDV